MDGSPAMPTEERDLLYLILTLTAEEACIPKSRRYLQYVVRVPLPQKPSHPLPSIAVITAYALRPHAPSGTRTR